MNLHVILLNSNPESSSQMVGRAVQTALPIILFKFLLTSASGQNLNQMKFQHLLLSALFLFAVSATYAQRSDKHEVQQQTHMLKKMQHQREHMQNQKQLGQTMHCSEMASTMKNQSRPPVVKTPAANKLMPTWYVRTGASGNNDGTSWDDAFTDLQDALTASTLNDQIWVAAGTYFPGNTDAATFHLSYDLELYGGFAGIETSIGDRNIENNPTILSGDLNGDDVDNDFETNREDNVLNVMRIENMVTTATVIDGFIIEGGQADGDTLLLSEVRGAGVWTYGAAQFFNCTFRQNYATYFGGGLYFRDALAAGGKTENCLFESNACGIGGGGMIAAFIPGVGIEVDNCEFTDNYADVGAGGYFTNAQLTVNNSVFTGNIAESIGGAVRCFFSGENQTCEISNSTFTNNMTNRSGGAIGIYTPANNAASVISSCTFEDNKSTLGGAVYWESEGDNNHNSIIACNFENNSASPLSPGSTPDGGAVYYFFDPVSTNSSTTVDSCSFIGNSSQVWSGAISNNMLGANGTCETKHSTFTGNMSNSAGGAIYDYLTASNCTVLISDCTFDNNESALGGALLYETEGDDNNCAILGCDFLENHATEFGGGFRVQSEDPNFQLTVEDCLFDGNIADIDGGGMEVVYIEQGNGEIEIRNTDFLNNTSGNEGAGLNFHLANTAGGSLFVEGTLFSGNTNDASGNAVEGAGGFSLNNFGNGIANIDFQFSIFENNSSEDGAGAIQLYKIGTATNDVVNIENCLLANNNGSEYAGGIGLEGAINLSVKSTTIADNTNGGISINNGSLELQNTILYNPGSDDFFTNSSAISTSLGGNLIGDNTMNVILNGTDMENEDPLFFGSGDYQLTENSPAVDKGFLFDDVSEFDLAGNPRVNGCLDIGAFESPFLVSSDCVTSAKEVLVDNSQLSIYPNPVTDFIKIWLTNDWHGTIQVQVVNSLGQKVYAGNFEKTYGEITWEMDTNKLPKGVYQLLLSNDGEMMVKSITKL